MNELRPRSARVWLALLRVVEILLILVTIGVVAYAGCELERKRLVWQVTR